jgi:hypothetical protein
MKRIPEKVAGILGLLGVGLQNATKRTKGTGPRRLANTGIPSGSLAKDRKGRPVLRDVEQVTVGCHQHRDSTQTGLRQDQAVVELLRWQQARGSNPSSLRPDSAA